MLAAGLLMAADWSFAQSPTSPPKAAPAGDYQAKAEQYARARGAFEEEAGAYWRSVSEKRAARNAKRRNNEPIGLDDYVLTQPPVYQGPPRPVDPAAPDKDPTEPRKPTFRSSPIFSRRPPSSSASCRTGRRARSHSSAPT